MNGPHEMIVKLGEELKWDAFVRRDKTVKAVKMPVDFLLETNLGYLPGKRGDFIVEVGPRIRFPCGSTDFLDAYLPVEQADGDRRKVSDRRAPHD